MHHAKPQVEPGEKEEGKTQELSGQQKVFSGLIETRYKLNQVGYNDQNPNLYRLPSSSDEMEDESEDEEEEAEAEEADENNQAQQEVSHVNNLQGQTQTTMANVL